MTYFPPPPTKFPGPPPLQAKAAGQAVAPPPTKYGAAAGLQAKPAAQPPKPAFLPAPSLQAKAPGPAQPPPTRFAAAPNVGPGGKKYCCSDCARKRAAKPCCGGTKPPHAAPAGAVQAMMGSEKTKTELPLAWRTRGGKASAERSLGRQGKHIKLSNIVTGGRIRKRRILRGFDGCDIRRYPVVLDRHGPIRASRHGGAFRRVCFTNVAVRRIHINYTGTRAGDFAAAGAAQAGHTWHHVDDWVNAGGAFGSGTLEEVPTVDHALHGHSGGVQQCGTVHGNCG